MRDFTSRLLPYLEADGVLSGSPSLGELGRLMAVAELIQTRIGKLSEATPLVRPFFVGDDQIEIADDARAQLNDDSAAVLDAAVRALGDIDDHPRGLLGSESGWSAAAIEARSARGGRGRAGNQAEVRLRPAADRRVGPAGVAAAVRVDGDPGQDVHADADPRAARHALIWGRVRRTGSIAPRSRL